MPPPPPPPGHGDNLADLGDAAVLPSPPPSVSSPPDFGGEADRPDENVLPPFNILEGVWLTT